MSGNVGAKSVIGELKRKRAISPLAGKVAPKEMLVDVALLEREYLERRPDTADPNQLVSFGTSGQCPYRRLKGRHPEWMVCRPAVRYRKRLQDLCREL
jgi:hypothetical protein